MHRPRSPARSTRYAEPSSVSMWWSQRQSPIVNEYDTTRVPGFMSSSVGRSRRFTVVVRYSATTVASLKSASKISPCTNVTRPSNALGLGKALRMFHEIRVVLDADRRCAEVLAGGNGDLAVACAEVVDLVGRRHLRHLEHAQDHGVRRRRPDDVLALLGALRRVLSFAVRARLAVGKRG